MAVVWAKIRHKRRVIDCAVGLELGLRAMAAAADARRQSNDISQDYDFSWIFIRLKTEFHPVGSPGPEPSGGMQMHCPCGETLM
jgi:hypothetical protein